MRKYLIAIVAAGAPGMAAPALADPAAISMQRALAVAMDLGLVTVSDTNFAGDEWQIEGRDFTGRYMEVDIDARTGEVLNVDR